MGPEGKISIVAFIKSLAESRWVHMDLFNIRDNSGRDCGERHFKHDRKVIRNQRCGLV